MTKESKNNLTYRDSGVDIEAGDALVELIKPLVGATNRPECLGGLGGFGGFFEIPIGKYDNPVLVSGTDGVGTKVKLAFALNQHHTIGIDLVAMCVNDILVSGAEPLFFLDYYATAKLTLETAQQVIQGIVAGCTESGAALIGGETAEMPGVYKPGEYDLAGFCVGIVEKSKIIDGNNIAEGDHVLGVASSGLHSNGYSLVNTIIEQNKTSLNDNFFGKTFGETLITPTRIYYRSVRAVLDKTQINGIAHITGGGLPGNISRILPQQYQCVIDLSAWDYPKIFKWLQSQGNVSDIEMRQIFNCGIGLIIVVAAENSNLAKKTLEERGETVHLIGKIEKGNHGVIFNER